MKVRTRSELAVTAPPAILVVDDDPATASLTEFTLSTAGYRVTTESRGDQALRLLRRIPMRLVVSELYIDAQEARCVVEALKAERARIPRLGVVVHTRHQTKADIEYALAAGADAVIRKPANPETLLREVERLAGRALQ